MLMSKIFNEDGEDTGRLIVNYDYAIRKPRYASTN